MEDQISTSLTTIRAPDSPPPLPRLDIQPQSQPQSQPSSPPLSALLSPPDSPLSSSSFPSLSSSIFYSSVTGGSPSIPPSSDHHELTQGLIIPSLTLPAALRHPTPYGQTLGDVRLLVLGRKGVGKTSLSSILLDGNEDVVEIGTWESADHGMAIRASTYWIEHRDAHGLETFEPARNIEIVEIAGYEHEDEPEAVIRAAKDHIESQFRIVLEVVDPDSSSPVLTDLISSSTSPLYTALVLLISEAPSQLEQALVQSIGTCIPVISLPPISTYRDSPRFPDSLLSTFRPSNAAALRIGLFRSPETLASLRLEATNRFLHWRDLSRERALVPSLRRRSTVATRPRMRNHNSTFRSPPEDLSWSKAQWEAEWEATLSRNAGQRARSDTVRRERPPCAPAPLDPLHVPSLFAFSLSLFTPLKNRILSLFSFGRAASLPGNGSGRDPRKLVIGMAVLGAFCAGIGIGVVMRSSR